jgi:hypothetical protein
VIVIGFEMGGNNDDRGSSSFRRGGVSAS